MALLLWLVLLAAPGVAAVDPASVVILVNDETPAETGTGGTNASVWVGERYAAARGIPARNILHLKVTLGCCASDPHAYDSWMIPWERFLAEIREPVRRFLTDRELRTRVRYIAVTYGVPTHIAGIPGAPGDGFAVDALLATAFAPSISVRGINPLFNQPASAWDNATRPWPLYAVTRLDGPSAVLAAALIERAAAAEKGIRRDSGVGYFDFRGLVPPGDYYNADQTVKRANEHCTERGLRCQLNDQTKTGAMIAAAPDALWAWGWYSGPTVNDVYKFAVGAVGAQLTSYTANSIRRPAPGAWVPLWVERGVTATWGATGEPYADGYAAGDVLLSRMWDSATFGEASLAATPFLNWKMIFVGDPLYTVRFSSGGQPAIRGVRNAASYASEVAPGSLVSVFGENLAVRTASAAGLPLPESLGDTVVRLGERTLALQFVSPDQVNAVLPLDLALDLDLADPSAEMSVETPDGRSSPFPVDLRPFAPGLFTRDSSGSGEVLALTPAFDWAAPSGPGDVLIFYGTGFGPLDESGWCQSPVELQIGLRPADLLFAGASPYPGVYQVNVRVPDDPASSDLTVSGASQRLVLPLRSTP